MDVGKATVRKSGKKLRGIGWKRRAAEKKKNKKEGGNARKKKVT